MFRTIWSYEVSPQYKNEFIQSYYKDGTWASLFHTCEGYIKTELLQRSGENYSFITIDYWNSKKDYLLGLDNIREPYEMLDELYAAFTIKEEHIGYFE